ncbi:hypothetical protein [Roseburia sp. AM59-24XD]|uniref:hypothetical protein n=1 Tax=Roseburia sp. AM59-24XD TaxID=2293138 RepID=UPI000E4C7A28|nr:hypothetical protein [Roseburia sp. AM59-24XD]RHP80251.1 hypothetical protein DXA20_15285 [Roseburia sp. AM59-24XD]DAZ61728.1 MAG TPA: hypothetical protein [Caudoviricetes sp.]
MDISVNESKFSDASVLIERARVLSNMLTETYFGQKIETRADLWKISGYFYNDARVLAETISCMIVDAEELLNHASDDVVTK